MLPTPPPRTDLETFGVIPEMEQYWNQHAANWPQMEEFQSFSDVLKIEISALVSSLNEVETAIKEQVREMAADSKYGGFYVCRMISRRLVRLLLL